MTDEEGHRSTVQRSADRLLGDADRFEDQGNKKKKGERSTVHRPPRDWE